MEKIDELIFMLHIEPKNDFEIGFNSALIKLLKLEINPIETRNEKKLKRAFSMQYKVGLISEDKYEVLTEAQKNEIFESIKNDAKLTAVKQLKEFAGMGLKESKDVIDLFNTLMKQC